MSYAFVLIKPCTRFVTEVHHIDGQGQDSGVVYSEMQGRENTSGDLMALRWVPLWWNTQSIWLNWRLQRLMDPPGSAYRSETGGLMEALRLLTPDQSRCLIFWAACHWLNGIHLVRQYHSTYYAPHNLSLIITGKISGGTTSLLDVVQEHVEPSIIAHGQNKGLRPPGWKRPFLETASANRIPVTKSVKEIIEFPERDESRCFFIVLIQFLTS